MGKVNPIPLPAVPAPGGRPGGLAEKIRDALVSTWIRGVGAILEPFAHSIRFAIETTLEDLEDQAVDFARPLLTELANNEALPAWSRKYFQDMLAPRHAVQIAVIIPIVMAVLGALAMAVLGAVIELVRYAVNRVTDPYRVPFQVAWLGALRNPSIPKITSGDLWDQGLSNERIELLKQVSATRTNFDQTMMLMLRGEVSEAAARDELIKQGWDSVSLDHAIKLTQLIPGPNELIGMAVKEAWDDTFAAMAGTDQGLPGEFVQWARKQGLSDDWCKRYWRAHWQLPSAQMGFEMLHRGIITQAQLDSLLKALDISPFWRPLLTKIAYNPYTRVDTRRMYNMQIIDRDGVKRAYLDQGYDEEHAENLTEFTIRDATGGDTEATKSDILSGYTTGMLSRDEAIDWLMGLDYPRNIAEFYLANQDAKKAEARKVKRTAAIKKFYIGGEITSAEASTGLTGLGLAGGEITESLDDWQIEHDAKTERPTSSQLEVFLKQDIITEREYRDGLKALSFQQKYIDMFTASTLAEKAEAARKSALAARTEQERLRTAREKTEYAISTAQINVDEAELATAIAETQVAISARTLRYRQDAALAQKKVSIATLNQQAQSDITALQVNIDERNNTAKYLQETIATEKSAIADVQLEIAERAAALDAALKVAADAVETSQLKSAAKTADLESKRVIAEHNTIIAQTQSDIAVNNSQITALQSSIWERRVKLADDLQIAARIKSSVEIETEYQSDLQTMNNTLSALRIQQSKLREAKAALSAQLQSSLKTGG
jgi:hypothetical protein